MFTLNEKKIKGKIKWVDVLSNLELDLAAWLRFSILLSIIIVCYLIFLLSQMFKCNISKLTFTTIFRCINKSRQARWIYLCLFYLNVIFLSFLFLTSRNLVILTLSFFFLTSLAMFYILGEHMLQIYTKYNSFSRRRRNSDYIANWKYFDSSVAERQYRKTINLNKIYNRIKISIKTVYMDKFNRECLDYLLIINFIGILIFCYWLIYGILMSFILFRISSFIAFMVFCAIFFYVVVWIIGQYLVDVNKYVDDSDIIADTDYEITDFQLQLIAFISLFLILYIVAYIDIITKIYIASHFIS